MHQNLASIGCQPLSRLCLPASHDAGMSSLTNGKTAFSTPENTLTQNTDLAGQLAAGFRYFDIRPVIANGAFMTGHYSHISAESIGIDLPDFIAGPIGGAADGGWQGGNGQRIADIIAQLNAFLDGNWELVVLNLSHTLDTDAEGDDWPRFTQSQLEALFKELLNVKYRFVVDGDEAQNLAMLPLDRFIADGPAVLIVLDNQQAGEDMKIGDGFGGEGFYTDQQFRVFNQYADSDDVDAMSKDQLGKMTAEAGAKGDGELFLLSWTLTTALDIRARSDRAHDRLFGDLWPAVRDKGADGGEFPNLLMVDGIGRSGALKKGGVAALCMAVNHWVNEDCRGGR
jgi:hypothetical protein